MKKSYLLQALACVPLLLAAAPVSATTLQEACRKSYPSQHFIAVTGSEEQGTDLLITLEGSPTPLTLSLAGMNEWDYEILSTLARNHTPPKLLAVISNGTITLYGPLVLGAFDDVTDAANPDAVTCTELLSAALPE